MVVSVSAIPPDICLSVKGLFSKWHPAPAVVADAYRKPELQSRVDMAITGCFQGSTEGIEVARRIRATRPEIPVILLTDKGSEALAVAALRLRLTDYFSGPFDWDLIRLSLERKAPRNADDTQLVNGRRLVGTSDYIAKIRKSIARIAPSPSNVLITGETGTGKEVVAELLHSNSARAAGPFVCINCAAIPDTLFESELFGYEKGAFTGAASTQPGKLQQARGGTVLLDEIGEMSLTAQAKILRVIETRQMYSLGARQPTDLDVRIIASTNQELEELVEKKQFRKDLYFRLNVGRIRLTPLRKRPADIPPLIDAFVGEFSRAFGREVDGFGETALRLLTAHSWPGNAREVRNVVESAFLTSSARCFTRDDLPEYLRGDLQPVFSPADEKELLLAALKTASWNKSEAARKLDWSRMTIYRKMVKYGLIEEVSLTAMTYSQE